jgi:hypothetical protein
MEFDDKIEIEKKQDSIQQDLKQDSIQDKNTEGDPLRPKSGIAIFNLPGGYLDNNGKVHKEVVLREITGVEEDLLGSRMTNVIKRLNQVMSNCIERIGNIDDKRKIEEIVRELPVVDRNFLIIALRRVSLGDNYEMEIECPSCNEKTKMVLDLSVLEVKDMKNPEKREYEQEVPSGKLIRWKVMTGIEEEILSSIREVTKMQNILTYSILVRLLEINGEKVSLGSRLKDARGRISLDKEGRKAFNETRKLTLRDRNFLREQFRTIEGGIESDIEFECPVCNEVFTSTFDPTQISFFFPSAI